MKIRIMENPKLKKKKNKDPNAPPEKKFTVLAKDNVQFIQQQQITRRLFVEKYDHLYSDDESEPEVAEVQPASAPAEVEATEAKPKPKKKSKSEEKWFLFHKYKFPSVGVEKETECKNVSANNPNHITLSYFQQPNMARQTDSVLN